MEKYSIVCHDGTFNGDCCLNSEFTLIPIEIDEKNPQLPNLDELKELYREACVKSESVDIDEDDYISDNLVGAWIVKEKDAKRILNSTSRMSFGRDALVYAAISSMKTMFAEYAEFTIGEKAKDEW